MEPDMENLNPNTEVRKLHLSHLNDLITILEVGESWKILMNMIPKKLSEHGYESGITLHNKAKFTTSDFSTIIDTAEKYHRKPTEILFQEWGTMGPRPRVKLGHLKYLLVKAELFAAADHVANLLGEAPPERPTVGPAAAITIPSTIPLDVETEDINTPSTVEANNNQDEEVQRQLDEIGYVQGVVAEIRRQSQEIHHHQVQPIVPEIVITEVQPTSEGINVPIVTPRPRISSPPSPIFKSPPNPIDIIDTNPEEDEDFNDTTGNIPNLDYLIQQPLQPISPVSLGEHEHTETSSTGNEFTSESIVRNVTLYSFNYQLENDYVSPNLSNSNNESAGSVLTNSDNANFTMSTDDNIPVLHILNPIMQQTAIGPQENENILIFQQSKTNMVSEEMVSNSMYNSTAHVQNTVSSSQEYLSNASIQSTPLVLQEIHNELESKELNTMPKGSSTEIISNSMYNSMQRSRDPQEVTSSQSDLIPLVLEQYHNNLGSNKVSAEPNDSEEIKSNSLYISTADIPVSNSNPQECLSNESNLNCTSLENVTINSSLPHYNYEVLKHATNNFSRKPGVFLGTGGFGSVFLARTLSTQPLAVKKLNIMLSTDDEYDVLKEFKREVENMHRYEHPNLVSLLGYSCDTDNYCLVYEFVSGGSLFEALRDKPKSLQWVKRVRIALGTAKGVEYLHTAFEPPMVHRDVKSANILLDANGNVKVCDYGISKFIPDGVTVIDESPCGTTAYMPLEYTMQNQVSLKMDSFSFGVVLLELLTSLSPLDPDRNEGVDLVSYSNYKCRESKSIEPILDQSVGAWEDNETNFAKHLYSLVLKCLETKEKRPLMTEIVLSLENLLEHLK